MEVWKDVTGYEGMYKISNKGQVYSVRRDIMLKPKTDRYGYYVVGLWNGKLVHRTVHRLVAQEFLDRPEGKNVVNHKDMNKKNNYVDNLEWVTAKENTKHAYENSKTYHDRCRELHSLGVEARKIKIDAYYNGVFIGSFNGKKETAKALNISDKTIYNRLHGRYNSRSGYTFVQKVVI